MKDVIRSTITVDTHETFCLLVDVLEAYFFNFTSKKDYIVTEK